MKGVERWDADTAYAPTGPQDHLLGEGDQQGRRVPLTTTDRNHQDPQDAKGQDAEGHQKQGAALPGSQGQISN